MAGQFRGQMVARNARDHGGKSARIRIVGAGRDRGDVVRKPRAKA